MKGHFLQYRVVDLDQGTGVGPHRHYQFGCDGVHHAIAKSLVYCGECGQIMNAQDDGYEQLGLCDMSCAAGMKDRNNDGLGFMYDYDPTHG